MIDPLTKSEQHEIRALVFQCANYDRPEKLCLLSDSMCITLDCMQDITKTATMCKYFRRAVLPLNPVLEARLTFSGPVAKRVCALCGKEFVPKNNRQQYCGDKCKKKGDASKSRERMKKKRQNAGIDVTI